MLKTEPPRAKAHPVDIDKSSSTTLTTWALMAGLGLVAVLTHRTPLLLALMSAGLVLAGLVMAAVIALRHRGSDQPIIERMLVPALLVFLGFASTIMVDPDLVAKQLSHLR